MVHEPYWNCSVSEFLMPAPMFQHYIFLLKWTICIIYTFIMFGFLYLLLLLWYTLKYQTTVVKTMKGTQYIMQKHIFLHVICICHGWQSGYNTLSAWFPMDGCGMLYACGVQIVFYEMLSAHTHISFIMQSVNTILLILNCTFIFIPIFVRTLHRVFFLCRWPIMKCYSS